MSSSKHNSVSMDWQPIPGKDGSNENFLANLQPGHYLLHPRDSKFDESGTATVASNNDGFLTLLTQEEEKAPRNVLISFIMGQMADYNQKLETSQKSGVTDETLVGQIEDLNRVLGRVFDSFIPVPQQHLQDGRDVIAANETFEAPGLKGHKGKSSSDIQPSLANVEAGGTKKRQSSTEITPTKNVLPLAERALPVPEDRGTGTGAPEPMDCDSEDDVIYIAEVPIEIVRKRELERLQNFQKYLQTIQRPASVEVAPKSASTACSLQTPSKKISAKKMCDQLIGQEKETQRNKTIGCKADDALTGGVGRNV